MPSTSRLTVTLGGRLCRLARWGSRSDPSCHRTYIESYVHSSTRLHDHSQKIEASLLHRFSGHPCAAIKRPFLDLLTQGHEATIYITFSSLHVPHIIATKMAPSFVEDKSLKMLNQVRFAVRPLHSVLHTSLSRGLVFDPRNTNRALH